MRPRKAPQFDRLPMSPLEKLPQVLLISAAIVISTLAAESAVVEQALYQEAESEFDFMQHVRRHEMLI